MLVPHFLYTSQVWEKNQQFCQEFIIVNPVSQCRAHLPCSESMQAHLPVLDREKHNFIVKCTKRLGAMPQVTDDVKQRQTAALCNSFETYAQHPSA